VSVFPEELHDPIVYPLALLKPASGSEPADAAARLYDALQQPPAAEVFERRGFQWLAPRSHDKN
jgi:ABC-type molybdate transport system substrate-binding protein